MTFVKILKGEHSGTNWQSGAPEHSAFWRGKTSKVAHLSKVLGERGEVGHASSELGLPTIMPRHNGTITEKPTTGTELATHISCYSRVREPPSSPERMSASRMTPRQQETRTRMTTRMRRMSMMRTSTDSTEIQSGLKLLM